MSYNARNFFTDLHSNRDQTNHSTRICDSEFEKYNQVNLSKVTFTKLGIKNLRARYAQHCGLPMFIQDLLSFERNPPQRSIMNKFPSTVSWNTSGSFVLVPNGTYVGEVRSSTPQTMRTAPNGFALCGWFVHPSLLEKSAFACRHLRSNYIKALDRSAGLFDPNVEWISRTRRGSQIPSNHELERCSGKKYLSSPLDLDSGDLDWLEAVRAQILVSLNEVYCLEPADIVDIYMHDLYLEACSTLHIHVRVNRAAHPLDDFCRLRLDDAIHEIRCKGSLHRIYLSKGTFKRAVNAEPNGLLHRLDGVSSEIMKNDCFWLDDTCVEGSTGAPFGSLIL